MAEHDGEVVYVIRGDDSELQGDLEAAEKKAEKSAQDAAEKSEKVEDETAKTRKEIKESVTEHHKKQNEEQEKSDEESGQKRQDTAKKHGESLKNIARGTAKAIGAGMLAAGTAVIGIGVSAVNSANNLDQAMNQFAASTGKGTEETERYKKVMEDIYTNNYGESFEDISTAMSDVIKQMGDLDDASLQNVTESAFALRDTFGYDIPESTRAAKAMMDNFGIDGQKAMGLIAAGAQNGLDYSGELMDSISEYSVQFAKVGLDADDMFKIFQKGAETGAWNLDKIGDAVKEMSIRVIDGSDTTREGFEAIGLDADEMAAKFAAGGESAKEAFEETIDALAGMEDPLAQNTAGVNLFGTMWEDLGPEVVTQLADIQSGAYDTADAMGQIKEVKYDDIGAVFEGLKRSIEVLIIPLGEQLIPMLSALIQEILPLIEENLPPLIEMITGFAQALFPIIQEILPVLMEALQAMIPPLMQIISGILPLLLDVVSNLAPLIAGVVSAVLPILVEILQALIPPLMEIIGALLPPLLELVSALTPIFATMIDLLQPIIDLFIALLGPIVNLIQSAITPLIQALQPLIDLIVGVLTPILEELGTLFSDIFGAILETVCEAMGSILDAIQPVIDLLTSGLGPTVEAIRALFDEMFPAIMETVNSVMDDVMGVLEGIIDFITGVFTGDWELAWSGVVSIFENIISGIANIFKTPINAMIDGINWFIDGINNIEVPDWVPGIGGYGFHIPNIPRLKVGMDYVPSDFFPAYLDEGEAVLTKQENAIYRQLGGLQGMYSLSQNAGGAPVIDYEKLAAVMLGIFENEDILKPEFSVYIGNKKFDSYIVKTSQKGINSRDISYNRGKGKS